MLNNIDDYSIKSAGYNGPGVSEMVNPNWNAPNAHAGGFMGHFDDFMSKLTPLLVATAGAYMGGSAMGLFGGMGSGVAGAGAAGAGSAAGAGLGDLSFAGLGGSLPIDTAALGAGGSSFAGLGGGAATGLGAAGAAGGLGSMVGMAGGAPAVVTVGAPAATAGGGMGLGGASSAAGGLGLGSSILGNNPTQPINTGALQQMPDVAQGASGAPSLGQIANGVKTATGGLGGILNAAGQIGGAITDYTKNTADQSYYQGLLNQMMGMYQPGTPEATLMQQQMDAKDSAAGRNSQYGVRATNLAGQLAGQRAQIMTSPTFSSLAQASRGHYDNSLNSLFGALGSATSGSGNGLSSLLGLGSSLFGGGSSVPTLGSSADYASNNWLSS